MIGELGVPGHFARRVSETDMLVGRMGVIPAECVARGCLYGSLHDRHAAGRFGLSPADDRLAARLPWPVFDPTTKAWHDEAVTKEPAARMGLADGATCDGLEERALAIYARMSAVARRAGFVMAGTKLEFGMLGGEIALGDSAGPDEFRLWPAGSYAPGRAQEAHDRQTLRDWLAAGGHKGRFGRERASWSAPGPPVIPREVAEAMTARHVEAYGRITGEAL